MEPNRLVAAKDGFGTVTIEPAERAAYETELGLVIQLSPAATLVAESPTVGTFILIEVSGNSHAPEDGTSPFDGVNHEEKKGATADWDNLRPGLFRVAFLASNNDGMNIVVTQNVEAEDSNRVNFAEYLGPLQVRIELTDPTGSTAPGNLWSYPRLWLRPFSRPDVLFMGKARNGQARFASLPADDYTATVAHFREGFGRTEYGTGGVLHLVNDGNYVFKWAPIQSPEGAAVNP